MMQDLNNLLSRVTSMSQIPDYLLLFMKMIQEPVCATAIVMWIKSKLEDDDFYEWTQFTLGDTPACFYILDEVYKKVT